jgi:hypothetical protein
VKKTPWLENENIAQCHGLLGEILLHSATPQQFETICERIRNGDDRRPERGVLIDKIYELVGAATDNPPKKIAMRNVYKAFWKLETAK